VKDFCERPPFYMNYAIVESSITREREKVLCHDRDSSLSIHLFKVTCPSLSRESAKKTNRPPRLFVSLCTLDNRETLEEVVVPDPLKRKKKE